MKTRLGMLVEKLVEDVVARGWKMATTEDEKIDLLEMKRQMIRGKITKIIYGTTRPQRGG